MSGTTIAAVLAVIVLKQVTGRTLAHLLDERIITPLGPERTSLASAGPPPSRPARRARPTRKEPQ